MKIPAFVLSLICIMTANLAHAQGGCGSHGGDGIAQEFFQIGESLAAKISLLSDEELRKIAPGFKSAYFELAVKKAFVTSQVESLYNQSQKMVDATNLDTQIRVNRGRWLQYEGHFTKKQGIVLHEYLGVVKHLFQESGEWDEYSLSIELIRLLESKTTETRTDRINQLNRLKNTYQSLEKTSSRSAIEAGLSYSCIQYSGLSADMPARAMPDAYAYEVFRQSDEGAGRLFRELPANKTPNALTEEIRISAEGDLYIEEHIKGEANAVAYRFCSKLASTAVRMNRFMIESLVPVFDMPLSKSYEDYTGGLKRLKETKAFVQCQEFNGPACMKLLKRLDEIKNPAESLAIDSAKKNLTQINVWLNSLGQNKFIANPGLLTTFDAYTSEQDYLKSLLDLGDTALPHGDIGVINLIDALVNRVPKSYAAAKLRFLKKAEQSIDDFLLGFPIR